MTSTLFDLFKRAQRLAVDNSPAILTAIGVTGTLTTAFLTGTATLKAVALIADEEFQREHREISYPLEPREKFFLVWKAYLPPVGMAALTVTCIICANRIGSKRTAAMAVAYSMSERAFTEYREKVVEKFGANKERAARDEMAQDRIDRNPKGANEVVLLGAGDVLCYDAFTGRYFNSNIETLRRAANDLNAQMINDGYASLSDFYELIGLRPTSYSDEVGWTVDKQLELTFSTCLSDDGQRPCISIDFRVAPIRGYSRLF